jgi:hypothetical protein
MNQMEIKTTTQTNIRLSAKDVKEIVTNYFKDKGFTVESYDEFIKTVYDGGIGDYGRDVFDGISIIANKIVKNVEL